MLEMIDNDNVRSSEGYSVSVLSMSRVKYSEANRAAFVQIEGGESDSGDIDWLVYATTLSAWEMPHRREPMTATDERRVLRRISEALKVLGMPNRVV